MIGDVAVLINPTAGRHRHHHQIPAVVERLRAGGRQVNLLHTDSAEAALAACHEAVAGGTGALVAIGGDGTVNLAMQAVAGTGVAFGAVPGGTGNDFVREIGLPVDMLAATAKITEALDAGESTPVDLARMDNGETTRWFGAVLGAGFDAIVNERANRMRFPRGPRRYDVAIVAELLRLRPRRYRLRLDDETVEIDAVLVAVGNTPSYGGGMRICPDASAYDGLLDVVVAGSISRTTLMRIKPQVYRGTHVSHPKVTTYRAKVVEIEAEGITAYVDGERTVPLPVRVTAVPGALRLLGVGELGVGRLGVG
jgi:diacylglycerol kinase (ATP)